MKRTGPIRIRVSNRDFAGDSLPDIYQEILEYLVDTKRIERLQLPIATSSVRYILSKDPVHQRGNDFVVPILYNGYYLEGHKERDNGLRQLLEYVLKPCGLDMIVLED